MKILLFLVIIVSSFSAHTAPLKKVTLITMEIPPFMSLHLPDQGAVVAGLRDVFKKAGYDLEVRFYPVPRTRIIELKDKDINGFFPSFVDEKFQQKLLLSKPFYKTPWVIVERKDKPIVWKDPKDLLKYKGGNVAGYVLRSQVARVYENNMHHLESAPNDSSNILKLIHKRVDFIFIDQNVFKFISSTDPSIKNFARRLQVNPKIIALNRYGVGFKDDQASKKIMEDFNKHLNEDDFTKMVSKYIDKLIQETETSSLPSPISALVNSRD